MCSDAEHIGHSAWKSVTSAADRSGSGSCVIAGPDRRLLGSPRGSWTAVIPAGTPGSSRRGGQSGGVVHASNAIHGDWIPASVREWWLESQSDPTGCPISSRQGYFSSWRRRDITMQGNLQTRGETGRVRYAQV